MSNSNPEHLKLRVEVWNQLAFTGGNRATNVHGDSTTPAAMSISAKHRVVSNLNNTVRVLLLQVSFDYDGNFDSVSDQFSGELFNCMRFC